MTPWREFLTRLGFEKVGEAGPRFCFQIFYHAKSKASILACEADGFLVLVGSKSYLLREISDEGLIYVRDLNQFHEDLQALFPEVHVTFSHFRDLSHPLAVLKAQGSQQTLTRLVTQQAELRGNLETTKQEIEGVQRISGFAGAPFLKSALQAKVTGLNQRAKELHEQESELANRIFKIHRLAKEYLDHGSGAIFLFSIHSNIQVARAADEVHEAAQAILAELDAYHKYQLTQKLGAKLQVRVEEFDEPALALMIQWLGGALNPRQLPRIGGSVFQDLCLAIERMVVVSSNQDLVVDGKTAAQKRLLSERVLQNFFTRLDRVAQPRSIPEGVPTSGAFLGNLLQDGRMTNVPVFVGIQLKNAYVSGTTRSGKSYLARVLVEGALVEAAVVVVLDPTGQWTGIVEPSTDPEVLARYDAFRFDPRLARGFDIQILRPDQLPPPDEICRTSFVLNLKGLLDSERLQAVKPVLEAVYHSMTTETTNLKLLLVMEEAHSLLSGNVATDAKDMARQVQTLLVRIARERVKHGVSLLLCSQGLVDFGREARIVREMVNSRFFLRSTDSAELTYVEQYAGRGAAETVKELRPGEALIHGLDFPTLTVAIRPPFSHVGEVHVAGSPTGSGKTAVQTWLAKARPQRPERSLSDLETVALELVVAHYRKQGTPMATIELVEALGLRSGKVRQQLVTALIERGLVKVTRLPSSGRGQGRQGLIPLVGE
ncbi:ATP-binding protein [Candidatus Micrarchaeota archaeon]|nr:ATP-binding protein [Candidatus Micrarchaeota archaeon]